MNGSRATMPTTYTELVHALGDRDARTIANNTVAFRGQNDAILVALHGHAIARFTADEVALRHCGYLTTTTFDRLRRLAPAGWSITRAQGNPRAVKGASSISLDDSAWTVIA